MIYLDSASTTKVSPEVLDAMIPYLTVNYGNPNSLHKLGKKARNAVDTSRKYVAELFRCDPENIIFTSGGCEANSMVFYGLKDRLKKNEKTQILVSAVEHTSVLDAASQLEKDGFNIFYLPVDNNGAVSFSSVKNAITDKTGLISVMAVNNETGALNDVIEIGKLCEEQNILFHVDCVQAYGFISKYKIPCDFASISSHKIHGAKGCGALYFADLLKYMCKTYFSWNGEKDAEGRYLLQHIGTEVFREYDENYWVDFIRNILKLFPDKWDYVVIPDCRFPNEIERFKEDGFDVVTMRLERSNSGSDNSGMNTQNKKHSSETALDEYDFDEFFINYGDIRIVKDIEKFVDALKEEVV